MPVLCLVVQTGPDRGRNIPLDGSPLSIGRGQDQGLQLNDGAVSRHHLTVRAAPDGTSLVISEITGVNPCWTLKQGTRVELQPGESLAVGTAFTLGNTTLRVEEIHHHAEHRANRSGRPSRTVELDATQVIGQRRGTNPLAALAALGDRLARCGSLQAVYRSATDWAVEAIPCARALLLTSTGDDVLGAASAETIGDLALSSAILKRVLAERRAFLLGDLLAEPELAERKSVQIRGLVGAMAAPAEHLIFYVEWGPAEASRGRHSEDTLLLLVCAAQLVAALGDNAEERKQLKAAARSRAGGRPGALRMIGASAAMRKLEVFLERVAPTNSTVLLFGESGTGKELAAETLHALSLRKQAPFVAINCAAIAENLLESELFGHERGAFTGAVAQHEGVFARAHGGTLFMDEVGELSPAAQARMLRVLENHTLTRVGGTKEITVDVRLIAATHRDLAKMVSEGTFRQDLLYRLCVIQTRLPPLRERREDIPALAAHFVESLGESIGRRVTDFTPEALDVLGRYSWPGNVRELRNVIERALVLGDGSTLDVDDLAPELAHAAPLITARAASPQTSEAISVRPLSELEREAIDAALLATGGNKARAAALLGIDRSTLYRKLKDHGLR